ncbi:MAG: hypothetical protein K9N11_04875 [Lentisphaeria bacterium]|nr:hypothetical protein [Candidatus Neomarinimicrobiota bacterium]MCF7842169.1 hypothetical protein [Lentisphaeria bacterium]
MGFLIITVQLLAGLLVLTVTLFLLTLLLPVGIETHEINTDKKFRGILILWGGLVKIGVVFPLEPGWKKRLVEKLIHKLHTAEHASQDSGWGTISYEKIWKTMGKTKKRLPSGFSRKLFESVKLEAWEGTITLGVQNPALTGMLYGTVQSFISASGWQNLYTETDFINRKSQFTGIGRLKIYPARIVFLAVKYGFKSLKLFPLKIGRGAGKND